ncbi:MAG: hypothetical protein HKN26_10930, partial [Acidimicrobiales bacterium]|nr:hypothetical protein [Acidimicrobiales bacterium]
MRSVLVAFSVVASLVISAPSAEADQREVLLVTDSVVLHATGAINNLVDDPFTMIGFPGLSLGAAPAVLAAADLDRFDVVAIALGNNIVDRSQMRPNTSAILGLFPSTTRLIWVTSGHWSSRQVQFNGMLRELTDKWANLELAEWGQMRLASDTQPDGIHLSYQGIARMSQLVAGHINGTVAVPNRRVVGHLDHVTSTPHGVRVAGWALDIDTNEPIPVEVSIDGRAPTHSPAFVDANHRRDDVAVAWNHGPNHGIATTVPMVRDGQHRVCVSARDTATGAPTELGCRSVIVEQQPVGELELIRIVRGRVQVQGWAY